MDFIVSRLKEPSTWRGLIMMATAFGVSISPETTAQAVAAGTGLAGLVGAVTRDRAG